MELKELQFNRFLGKADQDQGTQSTPTMSYMVFNKQGRNFFQSDNYDEKDARQIVTGTVITSCIIQTSALPNRVEISDNDARFYDDSDGGGGEIGGNTATIQFIRADKKPGTFIIQKRHGANDDDENVFEMFYSEAAGDSQRNYIFIGRMGNSPSTNYTDFVVLHGINSVRFEINRIHDYQSRPTIVSFDYETSDPTKEGVISLLMSEGLDGFVGMGQMGELLTFSDSPSFEVGDTITGNVTGATGLIIYKVDANNYVVNHTSYDVQFNPATDNACTTNGAGGGSGTGNLSATAYVNLLLMYTNNLLQVLFGGDLLPDADNTYDIGSPTNQVKDIYLGGSIIGGAGLNTPLVITMGRNLATASGAVSTSHGFGAAPSYARVSGQVVGGSGMTLSSFGTYNGTTQDLIYFSNNAGVPQANAASGIVIAFVPVGGTDFQTAVISWDATNVTLTWTKTGAPTGVGNIIIELYR